MKIYKLTKIHGMIAITENDIIFAWILKSINSTWVYKKNEYTSNKYYSFDDALLNLINHFNIKINL